MRLKIVTTFQVDMLIQGCHEKPFLICLQIPQKQILYDDGMI